MVTKQNPFVGRVVIVAVVHGLRRHGSLIVERQNFCGDEGGIVTVRDRHHAQRAHDDWKGIHYGTLK
jgi:hypothetical protein